MFKPNIICSWDFEINHQYDKMIDLYVDSRIKDDNSNYKVALVIEPSTILPNYHEYLLSNYSKFDLILTYDTELLKLPNSRLFEFGTTWIDYKNYSYPIKKFGFSTVIGDKNTTNGHRLRLELLERQNEIKDSCFFISSRSKSHNLNNMILGESKEALFEYQYSIIIENTKNEYYFSEKLIDCLLCKTIPIYYGATKIDKYFDNIIQVDTCDDIIKVCNSLDENFYKGATDIIENNFNKALKFISLQDRIHSIFKKI